jgi:hypothetical protein
LLSISTRKALGKASKVERGSGKEPEQAERKSRAKTKIIDTYLFALQYAAKI